MVTWENYEEMMLLHTDGELGAAEEKALMVFVKQHPELREELNAYSAAKLVPDHTMVFQGKKSLLRAEGKTISLGHWWRYCAAAGVILILLLMAGKWLQPNVSDPVRTPSSAPVAIKDAGNTDPASLKKPIPNSAPVQTITAYVKPNRSHAAQSPTGVHSNHNGQPSMEKSDMASIQHIAPSLRLPETAAVAITAAPASIPAYVDQPLPQDQPQEFLAWLPMTDEKKEGIQGLKTNLREKISRAKDIKDNLKETALVVKLGNRDIHLNF